MTDEYDVYEETPVVTGLTEEEMEGAYGGTAWRLAQSLVVLGREIDAKFPKRSKAADGTIGDASHASRASRHNPNTKGVVCARDFTHDPPYLDIHALVRDLVRHPHPDLAYIVSNRQIAARKDGFKWRKYSGSSPHTGHAHIGVGVGPDAEPRPPYDDSTAWGLVAPTPVTGRVLKVRKPYLEGADVLWVQKLMNRLKCYPQGKTPHLKEDSVYGPDTAKCVEVFQYRNQLTIDGVVGPKTWEVMRRA